MRSTQFSGNHETQTNNLKQPQIIPQKSIIHITYFSKIPSLEFSLEKLLYRKYIEISYILIKIWWHNKIGWKPSLCFLCFLLLNIFWHKKIPKAKVLKFGLGFVAIYIILSASIWENSELTNSNYGYKITFKYQTINSILDLSFYICIQYEHVSFKLDI